MGEHEDDLVVPDDGAALGPQGPVSPYPNDVARVLSHLAKLIDRSIALRGVGNGRREFAARFLGAPAMELIATSRELGPLSFQLVGLAFAATCHEHPPLAVVGEDMEEPPRWERIELGERCVSVPYELTAAFSPGTIAPCAVVVAFETDLYDRLSVSVWSSAGNADAASAWLDELTAASRRSMNPFRNQILRASNRARVGLWFEVTDLATSSRAEVVLRSEVWGEVDRSITGLFARRELLASAGLSTNRGLLLAGAPGTGKTALCRAIANELAGRATVIFCDAAVVSGQIKELYRELDHLAPALVVMEDLDLAIGHRGGRGADTLNDFLLALDGAMTTHAGVVTIATTNDPAAIDAAARRAGRFDAVVRVDPPDADGRAAILRRYVDPLGRGDIDVDRVAAATNGWTGAELRELVTRAVLDLGCDEQATITTEQLIGLARERPASDWPGSYL